ncbi:hypothetical protein CGRA01v4_07693 [Colletotrichum graminicola]|nr:hypothetical protein CGRA01v4_07693 [Colletotrichum graminicola]
MIHSPQRGGNGVESEARKWSRGEAGGIKTPGRTPTTCLSWPT